MGREGCQQSTILCVCELQRAVVRTEHEDRLAWMGGKACDGACLCRVGVGLQAKVNCAGSWVPDPYGPIL